MSRDTSDKLEHTFEGIELQLLVSVLLQKLSEVDWVEYFNECMYVCDTELLTEVRASAVGPLNPHGAA